MAPSPLRSLTRRHTRSVSFPSRSHPLMPQLEEQICRLKASEAIPSSLSSMSSRICDLKNLYHSTDDVLLLPHIQQAISQECQEKLVDEMLDGYLRLLDACSTTRDILSYAKQNVQELLSALRRKDRDGISGYITSRTKSKKMIQKVMKDFRRIRNKQTGLAPVRDNETIAVSSMLQDVESITMSMFESLLFYVNSTKVHSTRQSRWFLVSKLMNTRVSSTREEEEESKTNEFEEVDTFVHQNIANNDYEGIQNQLEKIESSIQALEEELECFFRHLIKSRAFLLNVFNH